MNFENNIKIPAHTTDLSIGTHHSLLKIKGVKNMLEYNHCINSVEDFKDFIVTVYTIIDDIYKKIIPKHIQDRRNKSKATLSDSEIITISIVGELLTIDSENAWYNFCKKNFNDLFPKLCDRSRFNRVRRGLHAVIDEIRKEIGRITTLPEQRYRIIDSIPIPVCKFGRAKFHKTFRGHGAAFGKCPSKKETYLGYKLHLVITLEGFVTDYILTSANIDDREAAWDLPDKFNSHTFFGDKGYTDNEFTSALKAERGITMLPLKKSNDKTQFFKELRQLIFKKRRRVETSASQLTEHLNIETVKAKSLWGLISRIKTKILAYDLCFYINMLLGNIILIKDQRVNILISTTG